MGSKPQGISGSRVAACLGLSDYQTPVDVWLRIMEDLTPGFCKARGYLEPEPVDNAAVRWGSAFEDAIIQAAHYEYYCVNTITDQERLFVHPEHDFLTCHVDGIYYVDGKPDALHEGKTTNKFAFDLKWGEPGTNRIPREYQLQVQLQMMLSEIDTCIVSVLVFPERQQVWEDIGRKVILAEDSEVKIDPVKWTDALVEMGYFHQYKIEAHERLQELIEKRLVAFWNRYVLEAEPPRAQTHEDIKKLCPEPKGTIVADEEIERLSREYKDINDEFKRVGKRKDEVKSHILDYMRQNAEQNIDDESTEKWILYSRNGKKLHSYNGKVFR